MSASPLWVIQTRNRLAWRIRTERDEDTLRAVAALLGVKT